MNPTTEGQPMNTTTMRPAPGPAPGPGAARVRSWPILLLALPAFVAIWSGWVGLGGLTGFGEIHPLPGTPLRGWTLDTAITLPIGVETYAAYALHVWLTGDPARRAARFAKWSAIGSLGLGAGGQVAYHLMTAAHGPQAPMVITALVACLPVAVLGMGAALAHLVGEVTTDPMPSSPTGERGDDATPVAPSPTPGTAPAAGDTREASPPKVSRPRPGATGRTGTDTAAKVARLRAKHPDLTQAGVAKELKVTERTVRRYWTASTTTLAAADPDGPAPTTTITTGPRTQADPASRAA